MFLSWMHLGLREAKWLLAGPVPTASVEDVVHLAKGLMRRVQNYAPQLMEL